MKQNLPFFSIVISTFARSRQLAICLQSLTFLDYPRDRFEVIVVDDGSKTPPEAVVAPFSSQLNITLLTQPHAGPATARNTGAFQAQGEFLAFTDDDCTPASNWLQTLAARFAVTPDCAIGGRTLNQLSDNLYSTASQILVDYLYTYYNTDPTQARFCTSNNLALPADRFHMLGGFDISFPFAAGEDREFCEHWLQHGNRLLYAPEVLVYHTHGLTFSTFWQQQFTYGRGAFHFRQIRARRHQGRIRVEPLAFYLHLLRYPLSQVQGWQALLLVGLLLLSQGAITAGFLWERMFCRSSTTGYAPGSTGASSVARGAGGFSRR